MTVTLEDRGKGANNGYSRKGTAFRCRASGEAL